MNKVILIFSIFFSLGAIACNSDYQCGYGNRCVKAEGDFHFDGICVQVKDEYGNKDYNSDSTWGGGYGPKEISSCTWDGDCGIGGKCFKRSGSYNGICLK